MWNRDSGYAEISYLGALMIGNAYLAFLRYIQRIKHDRWRYDAASHTGLMLKQRLIQMIAAWPCVTRAASRLGIASTGNGGDTSLRDLSLPL